MVKAREHGQHSTRSRRPLNRTDWVIERVTARMRVAVPTLDEFLKVLEYAQQQESPQRAPTTGPSQRPLRRISARPLVHWPAEGDSGIPIDPAVATSAEKSLPGDAAQTGLLWMPGQDAPSPGLVFSAPTAPPRVDRGPVTANIQSSQAVPPPDQTHDSPPCHLPAPHQEIIFMRFSGPDGRPTVFPARIEPECSVSLFPSNLAISLGWRMDAHGTEREIFPTAGHRESLSSLGRLSPEWFIRDLEIYLRPESTEPDLTVNIYLTPIPDYASSSFTDMAHVERCWNTPYVVLSRSFLERTTSLGCQLPNNPRVI